MHASVGLASITQPMKEGEKKEEGREGGREKRREEGRKVQIKNSPETLKRRRPMGRN